jgi:hypothetical protein
LSGALLRQRLILTLESSCPHEAFYKVRSGVARSNQREQKGLVYVVPQEHYGPQSSGDRSDREVHRQLLASSPPEAGSPVDFLKPPTVLAPCPTAPMTSPSIKNIKVCVTFISYSSIFLRI